MSKIIDDRQKRCMCGHLKLLHMGNFKNECDACDSPEIPLDKRCPGFREVIDHWKQNGPSMKPE
jgi:hypothetical protein